MPYVLEVVKKLLMMRNGKRANKAEEQRVRRRINAL